MAKNDASIKFNVSKWAEEHKNSFSPPICNKMMYGAGQLKVMFVGGPNVRDDFHLEEGEEFFYQMKGNINLVIMEKGKRKNINIREGFCFLLPSCIPHSPVRPEEGSLGLVIERERMKSEIDAMRWYCKKDSNQLLYEKWFHCYSLGKQLVPIVKEFKKSEEAKTDEPGKNINSNPPMEIDVTTTTSEPVHLQTWIDNHMEELKNKKQVAMFDGIETEVTIETGDLTATRQLKFRETWLYQIKGECTVKFSSNREDVLLNESDCCLVAENEEFTVLRKPGSFGMVVSMKNHNLNKKRSSDNESGSTAKRRRISINESG